MIVCLCHGVSDRQIRGAMADGARSLAELGARCRAGTGCGACRPMLRRILRVAGVDDVQPLALAPTAPPVGLRAASACATCPASNVPGRPALAAASASE